ncbi:Hypothetical predicted protein [Octopus vulgaris]|uniref:Uncharacterized protein n=1 Tax=Octopus vulgaris TaxID=6645 RepID=A0AA36AT12_OCTVU|nr:Hypothetical predicted protein [Octopus vulgaris]
MGKCFLRYQFDQHLIYRISLDNYAKACSLIAQTVGNDLQSVINEVVQMVNRIKRRPLKSRLFVHICEEMGARFKKCLLHTEHLIKDILI